MYGVIMHPREYFDNITMRVTNLFKVSRERLIFGGYSGGGGDRSRTYIPPQEFEVMEREGIYDIMCLRVVFA